MDCGGIPSEPLRYNGDVSTAHESRSSGGHAWEQGGIVVDAQHWPLLVETMPAVFPDDEATIDAWIEHVDGLMRARGATPFVMLVSGTHVSKPPNAKTRQKMAQWLSECEPYQKHCLRSVFVFSSPIARGIMIAIDWIARPHPPRTIVATMSEALSICRRELEAAGQRWPSSVGSDFPGATSSR